MAKKVPMSSTRRKAVRKPKSSASSAEASVKGDFIWTRKDLLGLDDLSSREIVHLLNTAESFREVSLQKQFK